MHRHPAAQDIKIATDAAILTVKDGALQVLLIQMKKKPYQGRWALPGSLLADDETTEAAARRALRESAGVTGAYLEQLRTFDDPKRDPFGRVVSVAWFALMPSEGVRLRTSDKYSDVRWHPVAAVAKLAYDHSRILAAAVARLRAKLEYTNVVWSLLPEAFTLTDLQAVYEAILGRALDKRNFRKKIISLGLLQATGRSRRDGAHRPAALHRFRKRELAMIDVL